MTCEAKERELQGHWSSREGSLDATVGERHGARCKTEDPPPEGLEVCSVADSDEFLVVTWNVSSPVSTPVSLTPAEREVLALVIEGGSNAAIARQRKTSVRTVANQVASLLAKLEAGSGLRYHSPLRSPCVPRRADPIGLVEAAYAFDEPRHPWLARLAENASAFSVGGGVVAYSVDPSRVSCIDGVALQGGATEQTANAITTVSAGFPAALVPRIFSPTEFVGNCAWRPRRLAVETGLPGGSAQPERHLDAPVDVGAHQRRPTAPNRRARLPNASRARVALGEGRFRRRPRGPSAAWARTSARR